MNIEAAVNAYVANVEARMNAYFDENFPNNQRPEIRVEKLRVRYRVIAGGSVHSFVDFDGNIYKPANFKAPAKGIRGNVFDDNGSKAMGHGYTVRYLG